MYGADGRGFDWKEIAEVLHITRVMDRSTFWRQIKKLDQKRKTPAPAIVPYDFTRRGPARPANSEKSKHSSPSAEQDD